MAAARAVPVRAASVRRRVSAGRAARLPVEGQAACAAGPLRQAAPLAQRQAVAAEAEALQPSELRAVAVARLWARPEAEGERPSARQVAAEGQDVPRAEEEVLDERQEAPTAQGAQREVRAEPDGLLAVQDEQRAAEVRGARPAEEPLAEPSEVLWAQRLVRRRMTMLLLAILAHERARAKAGSQRWRWSSSE